MKLGVSSQQQSHKRGFNPTVHWRIDIDSLKIRTELNIYMYIRPRFELTIVVNTYVILRTCTYMSHMYMPAHVAGCVAAHAQDGDTDEYTENSPVVRLLVYIYLLPVARWLLCLQ